MPKRKRAGSGKVAVQKKGSKRVAGEATACTIATSAVIKLEEEEQPITRTLPITTIAALSDDSLVAVFGLLSLEDLVRASQVCRRWAGLCSSRCLWSPVPRHLPVHDVPVCLRVLRTLRRTLVPAYKTLELHAIKGAVVSNARLEENASKLVVRTSSAFVAIFVLRELLKPSVSELAFVDGPIENSFQFSEFEAFHFWELIATATFVHVKDLRLKLCRGSNLFSSAFRWGAGPPREPVDPGPGAAGQPQPKPKLCALDLSVAGAEGQPGLCQPVRSLLAACAGNGSLHSVQVSASGQQALFAHCGDTLRYVAARPVPGLRDALRGLKSVSTLRLATPPILLRLVAGPQGIVDSRKVRDEALAVLRLPAVVEGVRWLRLQLRASKEASAEMLGAAAALRQLCGLTLEGFSRHYGVLPALFGAQPSLRSLTLLGDMPEVALLDALRADTMPSLRLLSVTKGCGPAECALPALRRLLARARGLHVLFQPVGWSAKCDAAHGHLPAGACLVPHGLQDPCDDCPAGPAHPDRKAVSVLGLGAE